MAMLRTGIVLTFILASTLLLTAAPPATRPAPTPKIRIGTYDNRAIAVAYAASRFNPVQEKMREHDAAKKAGDTDKVKALELWGEQHQRMLHVQGFSRAPVADLLEPVAQSMRALANDHHLAAITPSCDFTSPDVECIDITPQLVELFDPSPKTREIANKIRTAKPASILDAAAASATD